MAFMVALLCMELFLWIDDELDWWSLLLLISTHSIFAVGRSNRFWGFSPLFLILFQQGCCLDGTPKFYQFLPHYSIECPSIFSPWIAYHDQLLLILAFPPLVCTVKWLPLKFSLWLHDLLDIIWSNDQRLLWWTCISLPPLRGNGPHMSTKTFPNLLDDVMGIIIPSFLSLLHLSLIHI